MHDRALRAKIISKMRWIYQNASAVLVLDREMQQFHVGKWPWTLTQPEREFEVAGRLITSGWMHRLWTLSEAVSASMHLHNP